MLAFLFLLPEAVRWFACEFAALQLPSRRRLHDIDVPFLHHLEHGAEDKVRLVCSLLASNETLGTVPFEM